MSEKQKTIMLSEHLHRKLRLKSFKEGKLIKDITNEVFAEYLKDIKLNNK